MKRSSDDPRSTSALGTYAQRPRRPFDPQAELWPGSDSKKEKEEEEEEEGKEKGKAKEATCEIQEKDVLLVPESTGARDRDVLEQIKRQHDEESYFYDIGIMKKSIMEQLDSLLNKGPGNLLIRMTSNHLRMDWKNPVGVDVSLRLGGELFFGKNGPPEGIQMEIWIKQVKLKQVAQKLLRSMKHIDCVRFMFSRGDLLILGLKMKASKMIEATGVFRTSVCFSLRPQPKEGRAELDQVASTTVDETGSHCFQVDSERLLVQMKQVVSSESKSEPTEVKWDGEKIEFVGKDSCSYLYHGPGDILPSGDRVRTRTRSGSVRVGSSTVKFMSNRLRLPRKSVLRFRRHSLSIHYNILDGEIHEEPGAWSPYECNLVLSSK